MADEPVATGTLAKTPLAHLLLYLEQKALSGTLAVWPDVVNESDRRQDRILFLKGRAVAGRLMEPAASLREGMLRLFERREAPYAFYESNLLGGGTEDRLNGRVDPYALITESLRSSARDEVVDAVVNRVGKARLRVASNVDVSRFELQNGERAAIDLLLAEPIGLEELERSGLLPPEGARRLVYLLLITKSVAPYDGPVASAVPDAGAAQGEPVAANAADVPAGESPPSDDASGGAGPSKSPAARLERLADLPSPPAGLSAELLDRWTKIVARARLIENQN